MRKKYFAKSGSERVTLLIWMRSRTERRCGDVYSPIFRILESADPEGPVDEDDAVADESS